tara:strand:- start:158 stop:409 length:252 start_codon:yes stop_codon:yes gene_type:complete
MSEPTQLLQEEIDNLNQLQETQQAIITRFGQLEFQIQSLEIQKDQLVEAMGQLKENEKTIGQQLNEKYGNGTINLESGTFIKE